jgi:hypothetical protein
MNCARDGHHFPQLSRSTKRPVQSKFYFPAKCLPNILTIITGKLDGIDG